MVDGHGGGEGVDVGEFVIGAEFGGDAGEAGVGGNQFDGELGSVFEDFAGDAGAVGAPGGVVDFAPVDDGHEEAAFAGDCLVEESFDFGGTGAVFEEGHEGAGVENDAFHGFALRRLWPGFFRDGARACAPRAEASARKDRPSGNREGCGQIPG